MTVFLSVLTVVLGAVTCFVNVLAKRRAADDIATVRRALTESDRLMLSIESIESELQLGAPLAFEPIFGTPVEGSVWTGIYKISEATGDMNFSKFKSFAIERKSLSPASREWELMRSRIAQSGKPKSEIWKVPSARRRATIH